ncbi:hypothetical protein [Algoriphagus sp. Y33]|uniref:hypothetical protein n=1 Tax=Algoriphagus sp. Y33 TaxID=2772483 RepID=UPI001783574B|nr:hypothetical protein [Algoriphagus sp. Y33]
MIQRCISLFILIAVLVACKQSLKNESYDLIRLSITDSIKINESNFFISPISQAKFINDSLIVFSSHKSPSGIWIYDFKKNKIINRIVSKEIWDEPIIVSGLIIDNYPTVKILNKTGNVILVINLENNEIIEKIKLDFPIGKTLKPFQSVFFESNNNYIVEQYSSDPTMQYKTAFYKNNSPLGLFDGKGKFVGNTFDFPLPLTHLSKPILPYKHITQSGGLENNLVATPSTGEISKYQNDKWVLYKSMPQKSIFFDFGLNFLENEYNHLTSPSMSELPTSNFFDNIYENEKYIMVSTWIKNLEDLEILDLRTHLFIFDKGKDKWFETASVKNFLTQGILIGVKNDTIYFVEGNSMWRDEKYIKRAVLKPIEE